MKRLKNSLGVRYDFALTVSNLGFANYNADVTQLAVTVDMPDVTDAGSLTTGTGGRTAVAFARTFVIAPKVGATIQNGATGDYLDLPPGSITATQFEVGVKNVAGSYVARSVNWFARGH